MLAPPPGTDLFTPNLCKSDSFVGVKQPVFKSGRFAYIKRYVYVDPFLIQSPFTSTSQARPTHACGPTITLG